MDDTSTIYKNDALKKIIDFLIGEKQVYRNLLPTITNWLITSVIFQWTRYRIVFRGARICSDNFPEVLQRAPGLAHGTQRTHTVFPIENWFVTLLYLVCAPYRHRIGYTRITHVTSFFFWYYQQQFLLSFVPPSRGSSVLLIISLFLYSRTAWSFIHVLSD